MRSHDSARNEGDLRNLKVTPVHKFSWKPERGKPQHMAEAVQETTNPDLAMGEKNQYMMEPDLTMVDRILDTTDLTMARYSGTRWSPTH
ncbi:MAG: hypothetical protein GY696_08655 [Gammaproteobacteria bacterium]|nr:hypothetical protein [Gammaproteobacteria bacterium]